jgi:leucyl/phenylalanyl-tRNA--protein transferase
MQSDRLTPDVLLRAYSIGLFPMAEAADDPSLHWVEPRHRGIFPLDAFHVPRKLARLIRQDTFEVVCDRNFAAVIDACAAPAEGRETTWINAPIRQLYLELHALDHAHSVEVYRNGELVGGLYGVSLAGAFFGESMFHRATDASKVALTHLVGRLIAGGYRLLDAQFITPHLAQFGAVEIPRSTYQRRLTNALQGTGDFRVWPLHEPVDGSTVLAAIASAR